MVCGPVGTSAADMWAGEDPVFQFAIFVALTPFSEVIDQIEVQRHGLLRGFGLTEAYDLIDESSRDRSVHVLS